MRKLFYVSMIGLLVSCQKAGEPKEEVTAPPDPLPSWNDSPRKNAIIEFVTTVTKAGSPDFIPVADRIAAFDNDGTLWAERPYVQQLFAYYRVKRLVEKNPALATKQPFKAIVEKDEEYFKKGGEKALIELIAATHTGMSENDFDDEVKDFFSSAVFPGKNVPVKQIRYQPQLELLDYLRDNDFKVYICTGGTEEFVRGISDEYYGVPREQVIGTTFKYIYQDSSRKIMREAQLGHFNDKAGKPVGIQDEIGKIPVIACGNEGGAGDIAMLSFSQTSKYPSLQLLINHDDGAREFEYAESDSASLKSAAKNHWNVVSMKSDWNVVFANGR